MLDIKLIDSIIEKKIFLDRYNRLAKMQVPECYLHDCDVYGAYLDGTLQGGFAFAIGSDMAWPGVLPDANAIFATVPRKFCLEINLVWAKGDLHESYGLMMKFWLAVVKQAASYQNIEFITYAVDLRREYLVNLYRRLSCGILYRGEVPKYPGREALVFYTTPLRCRIAKFLCAKEYLIRFKRYLKKSALKNHSDPQLAPVRVRF